MQPIHEGLAGKGARLLMGMQHSADLEGRQRERLFHQHMLASLGCLDRPFGMAGMRHRNIDGVDPGIGQQGVITLDDTRAREVGSQVGLARIARGDGRDHAARRTVDATKECLGDAAGFDNAPANFLVSHGLGSLSRPGPERVEERGRGSVGVGV